MLTFFLLDDDVASRRMLGALIEDHDLGAVVGQGDDGLHMENVVINHHADVLIIDLLMPKQDGIETIRRLRAMGYAGKIVMLSQVEHKDMVSEAYENGVEYFIHKPINRIEVVSVLRKVVERIQLEQSIMQIRRSLAWMEPSGHAGKPYVQAKLTVAERVRASLTGLGVIGEVGCRDIVSMVEFLIASGRVFDERDFPALKELYSAILLHDSPEAIDKEIKAIEQRVRRTVAQALLNVASLGLTDFGNATFEQYATRYFDFAEVRQKMREIEKEEEQSRVRLNLKKFLYALYQDALHDR